MASEKLPVGSRAFIKTEVVGSKTIIPRKEWGALPAVGQTPLEHPIPYVMFTITETEACYTREACEEAMRKLQRDHMDQGLPDIRFNFVIGGDLNVYEARGWHLQPSVTEERFKDQKGQILEIAYIGDMRDHFPNDDAVEVQRSLILYGFEKKYINKDKFLQPK